MGFNHDLERNRVILLLDTSLVVGVTILIVDCVLSIIAASAEPSINSIFLPWAKICASWVNIPEVTTNPPVAPSTAITP